MNEILLVNPSRRRKKGKKSKRSGRVRLKRHASRRRTKSRVRRYKRNPSGRSLSISSIGSSIFPTIKSGALGAVGAIANDALLGQVGRFLPAALQSGYGRHAAKLVSAVVVGAVGNLALKGKGQALAVGAATVAMHGLIRETLVANVPSVAPYLGDCGDDMGGYNPGLLVDGQVGAYVPGQVGDIGEYIPGFGDADDDSM